MARPNRAGCGGPGGSRPISRYAGWKLEDAKSRFGELVRRARDEGPQRVAVCGADAVVVIAAEELDRLLPKSAEPVPFAPRPHRRCRSHRRAAGATWTRSRAGIARVAAGTRPQSGWPSARYISARCALIGRLMVSPVGSRRMSQRS